ncbi:unnamed protein product [Blepharisma stoltei]|uniref:Uncharacterized protein n=1 Tax=Blepharisma stoltei TaxID=1481888 RepID=A0AAU9IR59_9CILI|nr:unnamed protein product [Blepharisma stoltei]
MGCNISQKLSKGKRSPEEVDTSFHGIYVNTIITSTVKFIINQQESGKFSYDVKGTAYKIVVKDVISPDQSLVFK